MRICCRLSIMFAHSHTQTINLCIHSLLNKQKHWYNTFTLNNTNVNMPTQAGKMQMQAFYYCAFSNEKTICTHIQSACCTLLGIIVNSPPTRLSQLEAWVRLEMCRLLISNKHTHTLAHVCKQKETHKKAHTPIHVSFLNMCPHILSKGIIGLRCLSRAVCLLHKKDVHAYPPPHSTLWLLCMSLKTFMRC